MKTGIVQSKQRVDNISGLVKRAKMLKAKIDLNKPYIKS
jgi:hypothetical protein